MGSQIGIILLICCFLTFFSWGCVMRTSEEKIISSLHSTIIKTYFCELKVSPSPNHWHKPVFSLKFSALSCGNWQVWCHLIKCGFSDWAFPSWGWCVRWSLCGSAWWFSPTDWKRWMRCTLCPCSFPSIHWYSVDTDTDFLNVKKKEKKINNHTKLATLKATKSSFPENIPKNVLNIENVQSGTFKVLSLFYNICCCMEIWFTYSF